MSFLSRSRTEVDNQQLNHVQAATANARAAAAVRGSRSIGTARPEVRTTSGASRTLAPTPRH